MCLLWGGTALDDQRIVTKGTNADLWHMTEVTPAAIAFAAIVVSAHDKSLSSCH